MCAFLHCSGDTFGLPISNSSHIQLKSNSVGMNGNNSAAVESKLLKSGGLAPQNLANDLLRQLSGLALLNSPQLRDAQAVLRASKYDVDNAKGALWPHADISGNSKSKKFGSGNPYGNGTADRVTLSISYLLFDGGKNSKEISAKEYQEKSAQAKLLQANEQTVFDSSSAYLQIIKYHRLADLYRQNIERLDLLVSKMAAIVQSMGGRRSELTQVTVRLLQAKDSKIAAEAKLREYEMQLIKLVGQENMPKIRYDTLPSIKPISLEEAKATALDSHPLLQVTEADKLALSTSSEAIRAGNYWPTFDIQASKMSGVDIMGYSDPGRIYVAFKYNVFQGFSGMSQEQALLERANAAEEKKLQTKLDITYKLESAWADYAYQTERISSLKLLSTDTEQVRSDYFAQWETLGRRSLLEVLTAENEHLNTKVNLATSELDQQLALVKIRFESGTLAAWMFDESW
jgi:adhesin transport system outer membrane protein